MASMKSTGSPPARGRTSGQLNSRQENGSPGNAAPTFPSLDKSQTMTPVTRMDFATFVRTVTHSNDQQKDKGDQNVHRGHTLYYDRNLMTPAPRPNSSARERAVNQAHHPQGDYKDLSNSGVPRIKVEVKT